MTTSQSSPYVYQLVVTPDPTDGSPICSVLVVHLQYGVFLYDVSRDPAEAEALRALLAKGTVLPQNAAEIAEEYLGGGFFRECTDC